MLSCNKTMHVRTVVGGSLQRTSCLAERKAGNVAQCAAAAAASQSHKDSPILWNKEVQQMHTATREQIECIESLEGFFESDILPLLTPANENWQPADVLPDPHSEGFLEELRDLRARSDRKSVV